MTGCDFNMVLHRNERSREHFSHSSANDFKDTTDKLELEELLVVGW